MDIELINNLIMSIGHFAKQPPTYWIDWTIFVAGASLSTIFTYAVLLCASGNREGAWLILTKNYWIPIAAACVAAFSLNIDAVSKATGIPLYMFSYRYSITRVDALRNTVRAGLEAVAATELTRECNGFL